MAIEMELLTISTLPGNPVLQNYFKILFQFGNLLFLIPFRLQQKGGSLVLTSNRIHKTFCAITHALVMFEYVSMIRFIEWAKLRDSAFNSLHAVSCFACIIYGCGFTYTVWFRRKMFVKVFKKIESIEFTSGDSLQKWASWKANGISIAICIWYTIFATTNTTLHDNSLLTSSASVYFEQLWNEAEGCYLFRVSSDPPLEAAYRILSLFFVGVHFLVALPRVMLIQLVEITVLITCISLWHAIRDFLEFRRRNINFNDGGDLIFSQYMKLKALVKVMNGTMSILTCCVIGVSLPFYASWTAIVFFEEKVEWQHLMHFYFYFGSFFVLLSIASEFNAKSGEFYSWISNQENADRLSPNRLTSLLMDMQGHEIALKGSGIFIITYRFLGTILSVILTYTIIIIQFQVTKRGYATPKNIELLNFLRQYFFTIENGTNFTDETGNH